MGTLGGAVYGGGVAALFPHADEIALIGVLAITVAPLALLAAINPSFRVAAFTGVLVLLVPGIAHLGPLESAFDRVLEVATGGITALVVSLLVLPARGHALAIEAAAQMLDLTAKSLPELFAGYMQARDAAAIGRVQDSIGQAFGVERVQDRPNLHMRPHSAPRRADIALVELRGNGVVAGRTGPHEPILTWHKSPLTPRLHRKILTAT